MLCRFKAILLHSCVSAALIVVPLVVAIGGASGCVSRSSEIAALEARLAAVEARSAQVAKAEQRLTAMESAVQGLEETVRNMQAATAAFVEALELLGPKLDRIADKVDNIQKPSPRPSYPRPDPKEVYAVPVAGSPARGPRDAKVTLVRIFEFACPYCERSRATMEQLRRQYRRDLRIVYKHMIIHPNTATLPAKAACAAHLQKRFVDMEKALWEKAYKRGRDFSQANIESIARGLGLKMKRFRRDMNGPQCARRIADDRALVTKVGARGTPAFFINGRFLSGARPVHFFQKIIDEELAKANKVIRAGTVKKRDYYDYVVKNGKTRL